MGVGTSKSINQIINELEIDRSKDLIDSIEDIDVNFNEQNKIELYQKCLENEEIRNKCLTLTTTLMKAIKNQDFDECENRLFIIQQLLPLVMKTIPIEALEIFFLEVVRDCSNYSHLMFICLSKPLFKQSQISVVLSSQFLLNMIKSALDYSNESAIVLTLLCYSETIKLQIKKLFLTLPSNDVFSALLSRPLSTTTIPLFVLFFSFKPCDQSLLLNHFNVLSKTNQNGLMAVTQGLLQISQMSFPPSNIFDILLPFLSPEYPPALIDSVLAVLYNSSLFATELSPSASNSLVSTFILYSSPNHLTSNNYNVFGSLGKTIHRLLHNKNINVLYSLVNAIHILKSIINRPFNTLNLPEAFKLWNQNTFETYLNESKLSVLISHSEKILPMLSEHPLNELQVLNSKLCDEINTNQLKIEFNDLFEWSLTIWLKEIKSKSTSIFWAGF